MLADPCASHLVLSKEDMVTSTDSLLLFKWPVFIVYLLSDRPCSWWLECTDEQDSSTLKNNADGGG